MFCPTARLSRGLDVRLVDAPEFRMERFFGFGAANATERWGGRILLSEDALKYLQQKSAGAAGEIEHGDAPVICKAVLDPKSVFQNTVSAYTVTS